MSLDKWLSCDCDCEGLGGLDLTYPQNDLFGASFSDLVAKQVHEEVVVASHIEGVLSEEIIIGFFR